MKYTDAFGDEFEGELCDCGDEYNPDATCVECHGEGVRPIPRPYPWGIEIMRLIGDNWTYYPVLVMIFFLIGILISFLIHVW